MIEENKPGMSAPLCTICLDTGSKSQDLAGYLDCSVCDVADKRMKLREKMIEIGDHFWDAATDASIWRAYQLGKAAAAPVVPVAAQPVVPEGWKLVPEAPTPKMVDATWNDSLDGMSHNARNKKIYGAMLAAAPQPAASVTDVAKDALKDIQRYSLQEYRYSDESTYSQIDFDSAGEYVRLDDVIAAIAAQQGENNGCC